MRYHPDGCAGDLPEAGLDTGLRKILRATVAESRRSTPLSTLKVSFEQSKSGRWCAVFGVQGGTKGRGTPRLAWLTISSLRPNNGFIATFGRS